MCLNELDQPGKFFGRIAGDFIELGKFFAFGLADIENIDGPESVQRPLTLRCCVFTRLVGRYFLRASFLPTIGARMKMPFSPRLTKRPSEFHVAKSGNVGSIGLLACDEHDVAEAVGVKLRHCSEVCGEDFTVTGLQMLRRGNPRPLWFVVLTSSNFIVFSLSAVSGLFLSSLERQREETRRNGERDRTEAEGGWQGVSESAVSAKRGLGYVWRETGAVRNARPSRG